MAMRRRSGRHVSVLLRFRKVMGIDRLTDASVKGLLPASFECILIENWMSRQMPLRWNESEIQFVIQK